MSKLACKFNNEREVWLGVAVVWWHCRTVSNWTSLVLRQRARWLPGKDTKISIIGLWGCLPGWTLVRCREPSGSVEKQIYCVCMYEGGFVFRSFHVLQYNVDLIAVLNLLFRGQKLCPYNPQRGVNIITSDVTSQINLKLFGASLIYCRRPNPQSGALVILVLSPPSFWFVFAILTGWEKKFSCLLFKN